MEIGNLNISPMSHSVKKLEMALKSFQQIRDTQFEVLINFSMDMRHKTVHKTEIKFYTWNPILGSRPLDMAYFWVCSIFLWFHGGNYYLARLFYIINFRFSDRVSCLKWLHCDVLPISSLVDEMFLVKFAENHFAQAFFSIFLTPWLLIEQF